MKIVIIGSNGQLGSDIKGQLLQTNHTVIGLNHTDIEITDIDNVNNVVKKINPDLIINTAAMHQLDKCEENPASSFDINSIGARNLAIIANEYNSILYHFSTDYVFDGKKNSPYHETDTAKPLNVYGVTKLSGEYFIQSIAEKYLIFRVSGLYGENKCRAKGNNFVQMMLKLSKEKDIIKVVNNEVLTPTYTKDIARQIEKIIIINDFNKLIHITAEGLCSWFTFAKEIFSLTNVSVKIVKAHTSDFPNKVERPLYSVLENSALKEYNLPLMPHWKVGLKNYISKIN